MSMKEANLLLRDLICSFSWVRTAWMLGSTSSFKGLRRLWFTVTAVIPPTPAPPLKPPRPILVPRLPRKLLPLPTREKLDELMRAPGPLVYERLLKARGPEVDTL